MAEPLRLSEVDLVPVELVVLLRESVGLLVEVTECVGDRVELGLPVVVLTAVEDRELVGVSVLSELVDTLRVLLEL